MTSTNNLAAAPANAAAPAAETAGTKVDAAVETAVAPPVKAASPTEIVINDTTFELKGLSVSDGDRLYRALPEQYKTLADQFAVVAKKFERIADIQLPEGMSLTQAVENYKKALTEGAGEIKGDADPYLRQMDGLFSTLPGYQDMAAGIRRAGNAVNFLGTAGGAGYDLLASPFRFINFLYVAGREGVNSLTPSMTDAQARALGAAYAGSMLYEGISRQSMSGKEFFFNNPLTSASAGLESLALQSTDWDIPVLQDAWPYLLAAAKWIYSMVMHAEGEKALTFSEALGKAREEIQTKKSLNPNWRSIAEGKLREGDSDAALTRVAGAEEVAGIATKPIADAVANEQTVVTTTGDVANISNENGAPTLETAPGGQTQTRGDRVADAAGNIMGDTGKEVASGNLTGAGYAAVAVGLTGGGMLANKVMPGGLKNAPKLAGHGVVKTVELGSRMVVTGAAGLASGMLDGAAALVPVGGVGVGQVIPFAGRKGIIKTDDLITKLDTKKIPQYTARIKELTQEIADLEANGPAHSGGVKGKASEVAHDALLKMKQLQLGNQQGLKEGAEEALKVANARMKELADAREAKMARGGISGMMTRVSSWLHAGAEKVEHIGDVSAKKISDTTEKLIGSGSGKLTVRASRLGGIAVKFGRAIPLVGALFGVGIIATAESAHAAEWNEKTGGDGKGRNYWNQLDYDFNRGAIGRAEYSSLRAAQSAYVASGLGGLVTAGVTEGVQVALEKLGKDRVQLYLPPSLVSTVGEISGVSSDKAAFTQQELSAALAGVQQQARGAARTMASSRVTVGATADPESFQIAGMKIPTFGMKQLLFG